MKTKIFFEKSHLESLMLYQIKSCRLPSPVPEYRFHNVRRWRFDLAWPDQMLAVEIEGGTWKAVSRHISGRGFHNDCIKYNSAVMLGWRILRFDGDLVRSGEALKVLEQVLEISVASDGDHGA